MKKETTKLVWVHVRNIIWIKFHNKNMICFSLICLTRGRNRCFLLTYNTVSELMTFQLLIFVPPIFVTMKENVRFVVHVKILHWKIITIICDHHPSYWGHKSGNPALHSLWLFCYVHQSKNSMLTIVALKKGQFCTSHLAHSAWAYPSFLSMRWLGVSLLPSGWDANFPPSISTGLLENFPVPIYTPGWKEVMWEESVLPKNTTYWPSQSSNRTSPCRLHSAWTIRPHCNKAWKKLIH